MEQISVFDILKIGIGPSSSHTLGPWRASELFLNSLKRTNILNRINRIKIELYGSLSLTGKGHYTDLAVILGLLGENPETIRPSSISEKIKEVKTFKILNICGDKQIAFDFEKDIIFNKDFLAFHSNGIKFIAFENEQILSEQTYYSIGGGFVIQENEKSDNFSDSKKFIYPIQTGEELLKYCKDTCQKISDIVLSNELCLRSDSDINHRLNKIWEVMVECIFEGCHTEGELPGGLNVKRRACFVYERIKPDVCYNDYKQWSDALKLVKPDFQNVFTWVSCFAVAVNEVNASLGRVVTAPTNGSSGVIPAVLMYYMSFVNPGSSFEAVKRFLLVAAEIGSIFKKGATISAAQGGCQAEIGVSSAMAAGALCELLGGSPAQCLTAAEITMEHHLGLTCDPVAGLVQVPCIERNSMGAIKAITAAHWALNNDPDVSIVSLDKVVSTMWETALDMNLKYKETSQGGLAVCVPVNLSDC